MTTYLGEKPVGIGTIKAEEAVGKVITDKTTILGDGFTDPLKVNTLLFATSEQMGNAVKEVHDTLDAFEKEIDTTITEAKEDIDNKIEDFEKELDETISGLDASNFVKKSGDTMTGDLAFDVVAGGYTVAFQDSYANVDTGNTDSVIKRISSSHQTQGLIFLETKNGTVNMQFSMIADGFFMPHGNRLLGNANYPWEKIYVKKLNNGADITIPTLGGTLARIEDLQNATTTLNVGITGNAQAIQKTREDYIQADSEIHQMINGLSAETTTIKNNQASLGTQVANIEHKIPDGTTGTNSLVNKQILAQTSYTKAEVDAKVSSVYKFKGSVSTYDSLPSTATVGDVYNVDDTGANYAWDGSKWDKLSETIDLTAYATTAYVTAREQDIRSDLGETISEVHTQVVGLSGEVAKKLNSDGDTMTGTLNLPELNVQTAEGTLNLSITAGVATIATNNGLDIASKTKFDEAPTTDDNTSWEDANPTSLVTKRQVTTSLQPKTVSLTGASVELATNTIYNAGEMAALTITFPTTDETYISQLNFTSGATATAFTAPDTIKWVGDDVTDGAFIPATNKRYSIMWYSDGLNIRGAIQGII